MDSQRSHKAKNKGKEKMPEGANHEAKNTKRGDNWTFHETSNLLNSIDQVQTRRGKVGFSFNSTENQEIYTLFMKGILDSKRDREKIINRIKVVLKMFRICDDLAKRSGGGWDDDTHRPIAPSKEEYEDMVRAKGEKGGFLLKNSFPWYRKMQTMVGGQTAKGVRTSETWSGSEPIHCLLDSHIALNVSSTGSSDDPPEDSVRSTDRRQRSRTSVPRSGNSGSKRKSTDESTEPNIRGKKYKERNRRRQSEVKELADVGLQLAASMREDTKAMTANSEEETDSLAKLAQLDFCEEEHDFWFNLLEKSSYKRKWFLMHDRETIVRFFRREVLRSPNQGVPQPNPAANAAYTQFYPPNPAATNYFFRPNDPNRM